MEIKFHEQESAEHMVSSVIQLRTTWQNLLKVRLQGQYIVLLYILLYGFSLECLKFHFTALLEGICATLNLRIRALKLHRYLFEGCYFSEN